ncbi:MAG: hypothetical protein HY731_09795, partial [Candidatus Tectomicrobia bacterium]|nr:hypothetical protein [Candidatus Tectomicrobia bacterium]
TFGTMGGVAESLTVLAGAGNITFTGNVGNATNTTELETLTIISGTTILFSGTIDLTNTLTQMAGSVATTFNGTVTVGSAALSGTVFNLNNSFTSAGTTAFTNSGTLTKNGTGAITSVGAFSATGNVNLAASITTTNTDLTIGGNLIIAEAAVPILSTGVGGGNIAIMGTANGTAGGVAESLTVLAGTGNITFSGDVGNATNSTELEALTITSGATVLFNGAVNLANTLTQTAGSVVTTFNGTVTVGSAALSGTAFNLNNSFTSGGTTTFTNSSTLTKNATGAITSTGTFSATGNVNLAANITTANTDLTIGGNLVIAEATTPTLSTGAGAGNILISGTANGTTGGVAESLTVLAGTGNITFAGNVGNATNATELEALTVTSGATVLFSGAIDLANALTQLDGSLATTFTGAVTVGSAALRGVAFNLNNSFTSAGATAFINSGTLTKNATGNITSTGAFSTTGNVILAANITTVDTNLTIGGNLVVAEAATPTLSTGAGAGNIVINGTTNGATGGVVESLTVLAGIGNITFVGNVGNATNATELEALTVTSGATTVFSGTIDLANAFTQMAGSVATTFNGAVMVGSAALTGTAFNLNNSFVSAGTTAFINSGTLTKNATGGITSRGAFSATGDVILAGDITTANTDISFNGAVVLAGNVALNTGVGAGDIRFQSTLGATAIGAEILLNLTAGTGNIIFSGAVNMAELGSVTITSAANVTASAAVTARSIAQRAGTGTTTFMGTLSTNAAGGINLNGNNFAINNAVTTTNGGPVTITNAGSLAITANITLEGGGAFSQEGTGPISLEANIVTRGADISFRGRVELLSNVELNTGEEVAGNIVFSNTVDGAHLLTLRAGTGNVQFDSAVGGGPSTPLIRLEVLSARNIDLNSTLEVDEQGIAITASGAIRFNSAVTTRKGGAVTVNNRGSLTIAANMNLDGAFSQNGTGTVSLGGNITTTNDNISFSGPVRLTNDITLNTGATGPGNISFLNTVDGDELLTLTAGTGNILFDGAIGAGPATPLSGLVIPSVMNVDVNRTLAVSNQGIAITASGAVRFNGTVTTTSGGVVAINNTGPLTIAAGMNLSGAFRQSGPGAVSLGGSLTTTNADISFSGPVTLTRDVTLNSGAGNIVLANALDGTTPGREVLNLVTGGATTFGAVGRETPLSRVTLNGGQAQSTAIRASTSETTAILTQSLNLVVGCEKTAARAAAVRDSRGCGFVVNVFGERFDIVEVGIGFEQEYEGLGYIFDDFWTNVGLTRGALR